MAYELSSEDCSALEAWAQELDLMHATERADLLRKAINASQRCKTPHTGTRTPDPEDIVGGTPTCRMPSVLDFYAAPAALHIAREPLVVTRVGDFLKRTNLMNSVMLVLGLSVGVLSIWRPLDTDVPEQGGLISDVSTGVRTVLLAAKRPGLPTWIAQFCGCLALWFLMVHHINRQLFFKALRTFDVHVILGSVLVGAAAYFHNMFDYWAATGHYDTTWFVLDVLHLLVVSLPSGIIVSTMDSWKASAWVRGERLCLVKILLAAVCTAFSFKNYWDTHWRGSTMWSPKPVCWGELCSSPREVYASAELQKIIFLGRLIFKYALGWPFAFIRPIYARPDSFKDRTIAGVLSNSVSAMRSTTRSWTSMTSVTPVGSPIPTFAESEASTASVPCTDVESSAVPHVPTRYVVDVS